MFTRKSGKMRKKFFSIVLIILPFCFIGCTKSNSDINQYLNSSEVIDNFAKSFMPSIEELPENKSIEYRYTSNSIIISQSDSIALVVSYDNLTYEKEKEKLKEQYTYLDKPVYDSDLDYISKKDNRTSMLEFIKEHFDYDF